MPDKHPPTLLGATAFKPVERHGIEAVSWFLYDRNKGAFLGRTPKSWALITIFYLIYYSCLAAFWAFSMFVFMRTTLNEQHPRWIAENGLIGRSPGIGVRPSQSDALMDSGMFVFNWQQEDTKDGLEGYGGWVQRTQEFLDQTYFQTFEDCYNTNPNNTYCDILNSTICEEIAIKKERNSKIICQGFVKHNNTHFVYNETHQDSIDNFEVESNVDWNGRVPYPSDQFYIFDRSELGPCSGGNFGFDDGKPCILLKLNKIYGLFHDYFNDVDEAERRLKEKLPRSLAKHIRSGKYRDHVWVDCHGENAMDKEKLRDEAIHYFPESRGFSSIYYPYENAPGYQSPLVAVKFSNLTEGLLYHIECRAYAGNIGYNRNDRVGKAHFELMVHNIVTAGCVHGNERCTKVWNREDV